MTLQIYVEQERPPWNGKSPKYFVKVSANGKPRLRSSAMLGSVTHAKDEAEDVFGPLEWQPGDGLVKIKAELNA